ncbi:MAG: riboflavin biosynthesis protein RibF [Phycisphaerales bacterium]|nr:riboflavin biosynthesis protein RibF [Phycisphaerales bacterium]
MAGSTAILIGNFDGVHLGHRELIRAARISVGDAGRVIVLAFEPHPSTVLRPEAVPPRLTTSARRRSDLEEAGVDEVVEMEPTPDFLNQSPEEFVSWVVDRFSPSVIVEGADFRFGRNREGTIDLLRSLGERDQFEVIVVDSVVHDHPDGQSVEVHSAAIRALLSAGDVRNAAMMLGRPWAIEGQVVQGDQRGRDLGCPTANIDHGDLILPQDGIYAGIAVLPDGTRRLGAISIGVKPTFDAVPRVCEVHLLDHDGELDDYGWPLQVCIEHRLRDQVHYDSIDLLTAQIERDIQQVRHLLADGAVPPAP